MRRPTAPLLVATLVTTLAATALTVLPAALTVSSADAAVRDQALAGTASSMWQTDQRVEDMTYSPSTRMVYASGPFTTVRPPNGGSGSATGRTYLAAFTRAGNLATGFNVTLDAQPEGLALSPGGGVLYIAGDFTTVNGVARRGLAAVRATTGELITDFTADLNNDATAVGVGDDGIYVSGRFTTVNGVAKQRLARVSVTGAVQTGFTANLDAPALAIDVAPASAAVDRLLVGGNFTTVNGAAPSGMAALDPITGAARPWAATTSQPINSTCTNRVTDITHDDSVPATVVVTGEGDVVGCWEGMYAADAATGALAWNITCTGATQAATIVGSLVYRGSHQHDCGYTAGDARGGYVGGQFTSTFVHHHLAAHSLTTGGFQHWTPDTNSSQGTGTTQVGPRAMTTDGTQVFVGGDFTTVNGSAQQGLTRFTTGSTATPVRPSAPSVRATKAETLTVTWPATYDADSGTLTYTLYRGTTAVYRTTVESWPWTRPVLRYDDTVAAGTTPTYYVQASDGVHTSARSPGTAGTSSAFRPGAFAATTAFLDPVLYYRTDSAGDYSGGGNSMVSTGTGTARPVAATGAVDQGVGRRLGGGAYLTSTSPLTLTDFTQSVWFRSSSTTGGTLMAMSTARTGAGGTSDRGLMLDNNGNVAFQLRRTGTDPLGPALTVARNEGTSYRDNRWHLAVGTYDGTTARLYVDGVQVANATGTASNSGTPMYTRVGYVDTTGFDSVQGINYDNRRWPATPYLTGYVDDAAVYSRALSGADVRALYAAGVAHPSTKVVGGPTTPQPPAPTVPSSCFGKRPTIVNRTGGSVVGTRRADVIVAPTNRRTTVSAKGGDDLICGASTVKGGRGNDRISARGGSFAAGLKGGPGNDRLTGGSLGDTLSGGGGADRLTGGKGNDVLSGGRGRDVGNGGAGTDTCSGIERARRCER